MRRLWEDILRVTASIHTGAVRVLHHINMFGRYSFVAPELAGGLRPLRDPSEPDEEEAP